jgi:hypothetical protein
MQFLRNRGFAYKGDFDAKEAPKIEPISSIWGSFATQIASKMLLHFIQILGSIFRGFGDDFWTISGPFWTTLWIQGVF